MLKRQTADQFSSRIFLWGIVLIFVLIVLHNAINAYRMNMAYALTPNLTPETTVKMLQGWHRWERYATTIIAPIIHRTADMLIIYRCYLIWGRKPLVILLPATIFLGSISFSILNIYWFRHRDALPSTTMYNILTATFPLYFAQNVITTGLISYKIYWQWRMSVDAGLQAAAGPGMIPLVAVVRILVESAALYTSQVFLLILFHTFWSPGSAMIQQLLVPTVGIAFALIAIRTHVGQGRDLASHPTGIELPSFRWADSGSSTESRVECEGPDETLTGRTREPA
ncbi:hypothetical protein CC2G_003577 [Coprinopsis cinerea AmutBmut pab1-1]|nr:hypothetical protein CC2G_003577 [Coprinopsis cinerea AmutBmut pab1-1]